MKHCLTIRLLTISGVDENHSNVKTLWLLITPKSSDSHPPPPPPRKIASLRLSSPMCSILLQSDVELCIKISNYRLCYKAVTPTYTPPVQQAQCKKRKTLHLKRFLLPESSNTLPRMCEPPPPPPHLRK